MAYDQFLKVALQAATQAEEIIMPFYRSANFRHHLKEDKSPVTEVDEKVEEVIRETIINAFPNHGILGEEFEPINKNSEFVWTIDPIDGTQHFLRQIPFFQTLLS